MEFRYKIVLKERVYGNIFRKSNIHYPTVFFSKKTQILEQMSEIIYASLSEVI